MRFATELRPEEIDVMRRVSGLPVDVTAMAVVTNIWRAAQAMKSKMERTILREHHLTWASFSTLYNVWIWGPIETRDLARSQGVSRATVTSTVDTLARRGLVRRGTDERDRRLVTVELTPAGHACMQRVYPHFNRGEAEIVADLDKNERETLAHLLRVVIGSALETN